MSWMNLAEATAPRTRSDWIISPVWDLTCLVAAPLAIVPIVSLLALRWATPEQLAVLVIALASVGHHLPGFLRAYGERDLFRRFKWRFLLAPPLVFAVVLASTLMQLHALPLILMLWATWHILMQTYGFLRIYDLKRGQDDRLRRWLDFLVCLAIFAVGMVFSDARMYGLLEVVWLAGFPQLDPRLLVIARYIVGGAAVFIFSAYVADIIWRWTRSKGVDWIKLVLVISTGALYWLSGRLAVNMLVGVAVFEIFHAVQYDAIAWFYGRRLAERRDHAFGPLGFLYQARWWCGSLYLMLIVAYGVLYYLFRQSGGLGMPQLIVAVYTTSALLHFYYDGFIWKVRERQTQVNLQIDGPSRSALVSKWTHLGKWATLGLVALGLTRMEYAAAPPSPERDAATLAQLARWTPNVPELQSRLSRAALRRGDIELAVNTANAALLLRPRSHTAHADMGAAWLHAGKFTEAADQLRQAIQLNPCVWQDHYDLALAEQEGRRWDASEAAYRRADQLKPHDAQIRHAWGQMYVRDERYTPAMPHLQAAVRLMPSSPEFRSTLVTALSEQNNHGQAARIAHAGVQLDPASSPAHLCLGKSLIAAGDFADAAPVLTKAVELQPQSSAAHYQLGLTQVQLGQFAAARSALDETLRLEPDHALAHFQRGNTFYLTGDLAEALRCYRRCVDLTPDFPDGYNNLGAVLFEQGELSSAKAAYLRTLDLRPDNAQAHFNVGLLLLQEGQRQQAGEHFQKAAKLGLTPPPEIMREVGLQ